MAISSLGIGSGMDLNGLLDQLRDAEREKLQPIAQQKQGYQSKISAYGKVEGALSNLQSAVEKLGDASFYNSTTSKVSGDAFKAAAGTGAAVGSYSIKVENLAESYSAATNGIDDKERNLGAGTVAFTLGNGENFSVSVGAGESSLEDIRDAINATEGGVRASIVNDGKNDPYRLVLASAETGTDAAITDVDFGSLAGELAVDAATESEAKNARLFVNNIEISSQSNQVEGALEGITLSLVETGTATLDVDIDSESIKEAVTNFVSSYNSLQGQTRNLTRFDSESGQGAVLLGDSTVRGIQSSLRSVMTSGGEGELGLLSDLGISLKLDGTLELDAEKLDGLIEGDLANLAEFFTGSNNSEGFVGRVGGTLEEFLKTDGRLDIATSGLEGSVERLDERYLQMERSVDSTIARYRKQFAQLDSMIAKMNSTSTYLTQQFDMLNAQLGRE